MNLLTLIAEYGGVGRARLLWVTALGGVLAAATVAVVNQATAEGARLGSVGLGLLFFGILAGMYFARRLAAGELATAYERASAALRIRFSQRLQDAPLIELEATKGRLERNVGDLAFLSIAIDAWISGVQHLAFVVCTTVAVAFISIHVLVVWCGVLAIIAAYLVPRARALDADLDRLGDENAAMGACITELIEGFDQVKLDERIARPLVADLDARIGAVYDRQQRIESRSAAIITNTVAILLVAGSAFAAFGSTEGFGVPPEVGYELLVFFELVWAPLVGLALALPRLARAESAAHSVVRTLEEMPTETLSPRPWDGAPFTGLKLHGAAFRYPDGFEVGPIDVEIQPGELLFVTGDNGSGKTTLMKMLTGLYPLARGHITVDGRAVVPGRIGELRDRCTAIVNEQHLFDRPYGLERVAPERVNALIERLGIEDSTHLVDGRFTAIDELSTGQRMRLSMVVALLEDRPICVFDEWTANQDPAMSRWYYDTLLPELVEVGKAVVAVSHDDRYFDRADRVIEMRGGRIAADIRLR